jgi:benzoate-CoA ligase family protein
MQIATTDDNTAAQPWEEGDYNLSRRFLDPIAGERTALVTAAGPTTYARLRTLVNQVGNVLRDLGVGKGDRVLIAMRDGVEYVATWYAAQRIGAVTVDVYNHLAAEEHRYNFTYIEPSLVVTDGGVLHTLRAAGLPRALVLDPPPGGLLAGEHDFDKLVAVAPTELAATAMAADDIAMWKLTTGSTGRPKACRHRALSPWLSHQWVARDVLGIRPDDVVLAVPKLFSGYARDMTALYAMGVGATGVLFPERTTPDRIFEAVARHRPTVLVNVPTMMRSMLDHPDAARADLGSVRMCLSAGEQLSADLHRRWLDTFGVEVLDCVGSTEAFNAFICNRPGQVRQGSLGRVVPHYTATVTDDDGEPLPDGEVGVLQVTGEPVGVDYWKAPDKTAETFPSPGTLRTGDLFSRDADGYYYYQGRADDLLKVRGLYVAALEVENHIATHPAVAACAVVGYPTADGLTGIRAFVVRREPGAVSGSATGSGSVSAEEIQRYARAGLAAHKCPQEIRFVAVLPETATGKVDRKKLRGVG